MQHVGDVPVARAVPAAAAAVREQHDPRRVRRHGQVSARPDLADGRDHLPGPARLLQQAGVDLLVGRLGKVLVELADRREVLRDVRGDQLVRGPREPVHPARRRDGHGENHPDGAVRPGDLAGRPGGGACRDAVIDDDRDATVQRLTRPARPVERRARRHLRLLAFPDRGHLGGGHAGLPDHLGVDHEHPVLADGAHRQFRLGGHAELADDNHVERRAEGHRDLARDRHAAARQAEHGTARSPPRCTSSAASCCPASARSAKMPRIAPFVCPLRPLPTSR